MNEFEKYAQRKRLTSWAYEYTNGWLYIDDIREIQSRGITVDDRQAMAHLLERHNWRRAAERLDEIFYQHKYGSN